MTEVSNGLTPTQKLLLIAVKAETRKRTTFEAVRVIALLDAVIASGAVLGIFLPIVLRSFHYFDGANLAVTVIEDSYGPGESSMPHSHPCPVTVETAQRQDEVEQRVP